MRMKFGDGRVTDETILTHDRCAAIGSHIPHDMGYGHWTLRELNADVAMDVWPAIIFGHTSIAKINSRRVREHVRCRPVAIPHVVRDVTPDSRKSVKR